LKKKKQLREMVCAGSTIKAVAEKLGKTQNAIRQKMIKLELKEEKKSCSKVFSSTLRLPDALPSVEEQLKVLAGALAALEAEGLDPAETLRLRTIIQGVKIYKELLADYVDYRGLERELEEWKEKYAVLAKNKKSQGV
jgi:hypothetical protein